MVAGICGYLRICRHQAIWRRHIAKPARNSRARLRFHPESRRSSAVRLRLACRCNEGAWLLCSVCHHRRPTAFVPDHPGDAGKSADAVAACERPIWNCLRRLIRQRQPIWNFSRSVTHIVRMSINPDRTNAPLSHAPKRRRLLCGAPQMPAWPPDSACPNILLSPAPTGPGNRCVLQRQTSQKL